MKLKKLGALILGALLTIGVAAGIGATVEKDRVKAADEPDYSYTFTSKIFTGNGTKTLGDVDWTLAGDGGYWGHDSTKGQQFGSGSKPYKSLTLTSESFDNVSKIVINTSGASSVNANFVTMIGDTKVGDSTKLTATATEYTFTPSSPLTGAVSFEYTQTTSKALYIKSISVTYGGGTTNPETLKSISAVLAYPNKEYTTEDKLTKDDFCVTATYDVSVNTNYTNYTITKDTLVFGENIVELVSEENTEIKCTVTITANKSDLFKTLDFSKNSNNTSVSSYTATWKAYDNDNEEWSITAANNNSNGWDYVKVGRKSDESISILKPINMISRAIYKITLKLSNVNADKINSIYLSIAEDENFTNPTNVNLTNTVADGINTFEISNPCSNMYYKITIDCPGAGSNGGSAWIHNVKMYAVEAVFESIFIDTLPDNLQYNVGEEIDLTGLVLKANYSDGTTSIINNYEYSPKIASADTTNVTITYEFKTVSFDITVKVVNDVIQVKQKPDSVIVGQSISLNDVILIVNYTVGEETDEVTPTSISLDTTVAKENAVATAYYDLATGVKSIEFTIDVVDDYITTLYWTTRGLPSTTSYFYTGDKFTDVIDVSKWTFKIKYASGTEQEVQYGLDDNCVHIGLYSQGDEAETTALDINEYVFSTDDIGKTQIKACYKGIFSNGSAIRIVEKLNDSYEENVSNKAEHVIDFKNLVLNGDNGTSGGGSQASHTDDTIGIKIFSTSGYYNGEQFRSYANSTLTIESTTIINSIKFTFDDGDNGDLESEYTNISSTKWEKTLNSQARISKIEISVGKESVVQYFNSNAKVQYKVVEFARILNNSMKDVCALKVSGGSIADETWAAAWDKVIVAYNNLYNDLTDEEIAFANKMLSLATATWEENADCLQRAMKTYEFVVAHYGLDAFMGDVRPVSATSGFSLYRNGDDTTLIIILVAIVALTGFAFFYVSKRNKKEIEF